MTENFVSSSLSRKRFQHILDKFHESDHALGNPRNTIRVIDFDGKKLVVKSFKTPNFFNKIAYRFFRPSKAARSFDNANYLLEHNIGTPAPIGYLEKKTATAFYDSYYVSEYVDHDFTYREILNDDTLESKEEILRAFTRFIYKLHEANVYFLDNSPGNTLIAQSQKGYQFFLVDLNRMKFYDIPYEDRLKNFQRLSPHKWTYEIMGDEYARLSGTDSKVAIEKMWMYTQQFQEKFHKKKRLKNKLKNIVGKAR